MKKIMLFVILTLTLLGYGYSWIAANYSCSAFNPNQCEKDGESRIASPLLGQLVIDAAGYFLQSNSDYQLFLKKVELSDYGLNYAKLQETLNAAISNMELAHSTYYQLWQTSLILDYNSTVLNRLKKFDYDAYKVEKGLNPSVFSQVVDLLKAGNVKGSYEFIYLATGEILEGLKKVKTMVDAKIMPKIPDLWRINQLYLELEIFGQYVSEVFYTVSKMQ